MDGPKKVESSSLFSPGRTVTGALPQAAFFFAPPLHPMKARTDHQALHSLGTIQSWYMVDVPDTNQVELGWAHPLFGLLLTVSSFSTMRITSQALSHTLTQPHCFRRQAFQLTSAWGCGGIGSCCQYCTKAGLISPWEPSKLKPHSCPVRGCWGTSRFCYWWENKDTERLLDSYLRKYPNIEILMNCENLDLS